MEFANRGAPDQRIRLWFGRPLPRLVVWILLTRPLTLAPQERRDTCKYDYRDDQWNQNVQGFPFFAC
jgi:hypothetical protein